MPNLLPESVLLQSTPSSKEGVSDSVELTHRILGCELIQDASILLKLPQVVAVTGQNIMNRFFYRKSLLKFDVFTVSMGCVLLASKVEETFKTLREVIYVFHRMYLRRRGFRVVALELGGEQYTAWKSELITMEMYVLKELGFSLYTIMDHPHKYLLYFVKMLSGTEELAQTAWSYLNDSMRLSLSLQYPAEVIACATIHLAALRLGVALPEDPSAQWWAVLGADRDTVLSIAERILSIYAGGRPVRWVEPLAEAKYLSDIDSECAREMAARAQPGSGRWGALPAVHCTTSVSRFSSASAAVPTAAEGRAGRAVSGSIAVAAAVDVTEENVDAESTAGVKSDARHDAHRAGRRESSPQSARQRDASSSGSSSSSSRHKPVRSPTRGGGGGSDCREQGDGSSDKRRRYDSRERGDRAQHRSGRGDSRERVQRGDASDSRSGRRNSSSRRSRSPEDRRRNRRSESRDRRRI